jgi:Ca-activated chloride channel family protein
LKSAFKLFVDTLDEDDKISIVTYAGSSEIVLDSVSGADKDRIMNAIQTLTAEGSTAGANGIQTAYELAEKNFKKNGNNRIILASDGDFNVGISSLSGLENLISEKRDSGVYFSVLGFGYGNLQDDTMETLATHGNGNYSYIDSVDAAKKVLVDEMGSNLFVVANDTKAQIQFNAEAVKNYRLIGYENRKMTSEEFQDDKKDAGEIGVGTDMIVLVEFEPENGKSITQYTDELFTVKIRYKNPGENESLEITAPVKADRILSENTSDFNFAKSVAMFAELLRDSQYGEGLQIDEILQTAMKNIGKDSRGYRTEFVEELIRYKELMK